MFNSIVLQNFQSHKHSELNLSPGVNVIIGESDSGKSAIIRALYWIIFGRPSGDSMCRHRADAPCSVQINMGDTIVERLRDKSVSCYKINTEEFRGFGQSVPSPVVQLFNITDLNFMRQMDPPFLFSKTSGEVAQFLNRLINLEVIDSSLSSIKRMHSQAEHSANNASVDVIELEKELKEYDWIEDADKEITKLEQKEGRIKKMKMASSELNRVCDFYDTTSKNVKRFSFAKQLLADVSKIEKEHFHLETKKAEYNTLRNGILRVQKAQAGLQATPNTKGLEKQIVRLERAFGELQAAKQSYNAIHKIVKKCVDAKSNLTECVANQRAKAIQLKQAMPNFCPVCEQPIRSK